MQAHKQIYLPALDGLRFFAALLVAIAHGVGVLMPTTTDVYLINITSSLAGVGMTLFFVLSGFVIHYNYSEIAQIRKPAGAREFIVARLTRLYPLYITVILFDVLFSLPAILDQYEDKTLALGWHLMMMQSWFYDTAGSNSLIYQFLPVTPLTWSISTEMALYLLYLFFGSYLRHIKHTLLTIMTGLSVYVLYCSAYLSLEDILPWINSWSVGVWGPVAEYSPKNVQDSFFRWLVYFSPYCRFVEFFLGALTANTFINIKTKPLSLLETKWGAATTVLALFAVVLSHMVAYVSVFLGTESLLYSNLAASMFTSPAVASLIFCVCRYQGMIANFLSKEMLIKGGESSYSIYLLHMIFFTKYQLAPFDPSKETGETIYRICLLICNLIAIIVVSRGVFLAFEAPAQKWLRDLYKKNKFRYVMVPWAVFVGAFLYFGIQFDKGKYLQENTVNLINASYGTNCGAKSNNIFQSVKDACFGKEKCVYSFDFSMLDDPAPGCAKEMEMIWDCGASSLAKFASTSSLPAEIALDCTPTMNGINIHSSTYGGNCQASKGNATSSISKICNGLQACDYIVDVAELGDPVSNCSKDFKVEWSCGIGQRLNKFYLKEEAGLGSLAKLTCEQ